MAEELTVHKNLLQQARDYFEDVRIEMRKVTWPSKQEIYGTTVMVILTTFLFAFYFYLADSTFSFLVSKTLKWFLHRS